MKKLLLCFVLIYFGFQSCEVSAQTFDEVQETSDIIYELVKLAPRRKITKNDEFRYRMAGDIVRVATEQRIPAFLLTVKIYNESSFREDLVGKRGEIGLGQQHGAAAKNCDLTNRIGQLRCTAKWLNVCFDKCGDWEGALTAYGTTGNCSPSSGNSYSWRRRLILQKSIHRQIKKWLVFEEQRESVREAVLDDIGYFNSLKE